jgi:CRP-like cAMP-binding protein
MSYLTMFRNWKDIEEFDPRAVIFSEREPADVVYVILSGDVELTLHGKSLGTEGEGSIIGEMAMLDAATRNATATALSRVKLARLDRGQFQKMIGENPEFSFRAMTVLANRLRAVDRFIISHMDEKDVEE